MHILLTIIIYIGGSGSVLSLFASSSASACLLFSTFKWYTAYLLGCLHLVHSGRHFMHSDLHFMHSGMNSLDGLEDPQSLGAGLLGAPQGEAQDLQQE